MLFFVFVAILIVGIILLIAYDYDCMVGEWCLYLGSIETLIGSIAVIISIIIFCCSYTGVDGQIAAYQARHESLTYQYENDFYDNGNDLGKKELMSEIQEWNEDLAYYKENQDDFWIGIYIPDIYDQFEFIEYK